MGKSHQAAATGEHPSPNKPMFFTASLPGYFFGTGKQYSEVFWNLSHLHHSKLQRMLWGSFRTLP